MSETMRYIGSKNGKTQYQKELQDYKRKELNDICESFFQVIDYKIKQDREKMEKNIGRPLAESSTGNAGGGGSASTGTEDLEEKPNDPSKIQPLFPGEVTEE